MTAANIGCLKGLAVSLGGPGNSRFILELSEDKLSAQTTSRRNAETPWIGGHCAEPEDSVIVCTLAGRRGRRLRAGLASQGLPPGSSPG